MKSFGDENGVGLVSTGGGRTIEQASTGTSRRWIGVVSVSALLTALALAGCSTTVTKHGAQLSEQDLTQITPGMSTDQVKQVLGTPTTAAVLGRGNAYYYISSTMAQTSFFTPEETDRKVVAVYFAQTGQVERVANYGLKDGKVFDFVSRTTPSANTNDQSIVHQLFRNLGQRQIFGG